MDRMVSKTYRINEIFASIQGEGAMIGTPMIFIRFSGCNQKCRKETHGFDCDTEFASWRTLTAEDIRCAVRAVGGLEEEVDWAILTGGEPALQVDLDLLTTLKDDGWKIAIETNGSIELPWFIFDWVTVSPKVVEHSIRQKFADEVKYVRGYGQGIPKPACEATNKILSPAFNGMELDEKAVAWCIRLAKENPEWRVIPQMHKLLGIR